MEDGLSLSVPDRMILLNQFTILRALAELKAQGRIDPDNKDLAEPDYYVYCSSVIQSGSPMLTKQLLDWVQLTPLTIDRERYVLEVMSMYDSLIFSWENLPQAEKDSMEVRFPGFDFNNEGAEHTFATLHQNHASGDGRWRTLGDLSSANSHFPHLDSSYARMLTVWRRILGHPESDFAKGNRLTASEIREVLDAMTHPDNR